MGPTLVQCAHKALSGWLEGAREIAAGEVLGGERTGRTYALGGDFGSQGRALDAVPVRLEVLVVVGVVLGLGHLCPQGVARGKEEGFSQSISTPTRNTCTHRTPRPVGQLILHGAASS